VIPTKHEFIDFELLAGEGTVCLLLKAKDQQFLMEANLFDKKIVKF
jgi:hypothetical protein